jgi:hypothetical protein
LDRTQLQEFKEALLKIDGKRLDDVLAYVRLLAQSRRHETPAPIDQEAQPATISQSRKTAEAVTTRGRGLIQVRADSPPVHAGGFLLAFEQLI